MLEVKLRYGGHGGIPTQWEIRICWDGNLASYDDWAYDEGIIARYPTSKDLDKWCKTEIQNLDNLWPVQHQLFGSVGDEYSTGCLDLPQGVGRQEVNCIVSSLLTQNASAFRTCLEAIQKRVCQRCNRCLIITNNVHSCAGNNYNMTPDFEAVANPQLYSGCLECDDKCDKCPQESESNP